jgi:ubiquinone/menaquinone biosynthesis C-methylase UbiE
MNSLKLEKLAGLAFNKYPKEYKDYIKEEEKVILELIKGTKRLLDVGCGSDMYIPNVLKNVEEYTGIDLDESMVYEAKDKIGKTKHAKVILMDNHKLSKTFKKNHFNTTIALWNALGSMGDELHFLQEVAFVTKDKIILSLVEKGHVDVRSQYYEDLNSSYLVMDDGKETICSPLWGHARAFSKEDIEKFAKDAKLKVQKFIPLAKIGFLAVLSKK